MLPDANDPPARPLQCRVMAPVAFDVGVELPEPPLSIRLGDRPVLGTSVPKAAVNEDGDPFRHKDDVRPHSGDAFDGAVDTETKPQPMQGRANGELGGSVPLQRRPHPASNGWRTSHRRRRT